MWIKLRSQSKGNRFLNFLTRRRVDGYGEGIEDESKK